MTMTSIAAIATGITAIITAIATAITKMHQLLKPLIKRRSFRVAIVATKELDADARSFVARMKENGFKDVDLTRDPIACLGRQAIVLWHPGDDASDLLAKAQSAAPSCTVLVLSHDRLQIRLSEDVVACNSQMRLMGDINSLAELAEL